MSMFRTKFYRNRRATQCSLFTFPERLLLFAVTKPLCYPCGACPWSALFLMPQSDRNSQKENKSRGSEPNFNWRGVILIAIAFALIGLAVLFRGGAYSNVEDVPYNRFLELLENKQIVTDKNYPLQLVVEEGRPTQTLRGYYLKQAVGGAPAQPVPFRTTIYLNFTNNLQDKLASAGIQPAIKTESNMLA